MLLRFKTIPTCFWLQQTVELSNVRVKTRLARSTNATAGGLQVWAKVGIIFLSYFLFT